MLVTQGTVATDPSEVILPALEALRDEPVQVIAVTGGPDPASLGPVPANARVERYVPFAALMPHVSAYVTNGGYGGLHYALAHGVPVVSVGKTEDKAELAARVSWSGVGVGMKTQYAKPGPLRAAVRTLLFEPEHAARAVAMQAEMRAYGGAATAVGLLEELAGVQAPTSRDRARGDRVAQSRQRRGPRRPAARRAALSPLQLSDRELGLDGFAARSRELARLDRVLDHALGGARHVVGAGVRARGDDLGHAGAPEQQRGAVVGAPAAGDRAAAHRVQERRPPLGLAVVVDRVRAGEEAEALR